ncbi:hypothetical protein OFN63_32865, partial [Escherichia coli]|nr:hypothetical protein [Escherichia coli]
NSPFLTRIHTDGSANARSAWLAASRQRAQALDLHAPPGGDVLVPNPGAQTWMQRRDDFAMMPIRSYHTLLLLYEPHEVLRMLPPDASP